MEKEILNKKALTSIRETKNTEVDNNESRLNLDDQSNIFTSEVKKLSSAQYMMGVCKDFCIKIASFIWSWIVTIGLAFINIFVSVYKIFRHGSIIVGRFFKDLAFKFKYSDKWGKLSFIFFGSGSLAHKQYVNGIFYLLFEIGYILFFALTGFNLLSGIWNLGSLSVSPDWVATKNDTTISEYKPNALMNLITGLFVLISIFIFIYIWYRNICAAYNNTRIAKFNEYKKIHEQLIPMSNKIDEKIAALYKNHYNEKGSKLLDTAENLDFNTLKNNYFNDVLKLSNGVLVKEFADIKEEYLAKAENKFEQDYTKYAFNNSVSFSNNYYKNYYISLNKKEKIDFKLNLCKEIHAFENDEIRNDASLTADKIEAILSDKLLKDKKKEHKIEDKVNVIAKSLSDNAKTYSPFVSKLSRINYNTYAKFNEYFSVVSSYNVDLKFYNAYKDLNSYFHEIAPNYASCNESNETKKVELQESCTEKLAAIKARYSQIFDKKNSILTNKRLIASDLKVVISELRSAKAAAEADSNNEYANYIRARLEELTTACQVVSKDVSLENLTKEQIAVTLYQERINKLDGQYNSFASDKILNSLMKEELKLTSKRFKSDVKYIKTNYNDITFAKEETINKMLLDYDFDYEYARKNIALIQQDLTDEQIEAKINLLTTERDQYIEKHETRFVGKSKTFKQQIKSLFNDKFHIGILTLPVIGAFIFSIVPLVFSILIAFTNFDKFHTIDIRPFEWTGFETFIKMFQGTDPIFGAIGSAIGETFAWTFIWAIFATFSNYFLGILIALMINKDGIKCKRLWRTLFVLTIAIPQFISLSTMAKMLANDSGVLANVYQTLTGVPLNFAHPRDLATNGLTTKIIIIIVNIWVGIPYTILSTTGILLNIPKDLYESSRIDGAGPSTQFFKITMPYILFVTGPSLITSFIGNFNNFGVIFFLSNGNPKKTTGSAIAPGTTDLFITYIYRLVTDDVNKYYNVASAIGIIIFLVCSFISIILYNKTGAVAKEDQFQ